MVKSSSTVNILFAILSFRNYFDILRLLIYLNALFQIGASGDEFGLLLCRDVALQEPVGLELSQLVTDKCQGSRHLSGIDVEQNDLSLVQPS